MTNTNDDANANANVNTKNIYKKSRIRETPTLSTDADNRTDTNLKRLHDLSFFFKSLKKKNLGGGSKKN